MLFDTTTGTLMNLSNNILMLGPTSPAQNELDLQNLGWREENRRAGHEKFERNYSDPNACEHT